MDLQLDYRVVELLFARLCHDLVGPVTAINNGVELVTEFGDEMQGEALGLIGDSAGKTAGLLQLFRVAFGSARGRGGEGVGFAELRDHAIQALGSDRLAIDWPDHGAAGCADAAPRAAAKLLLNMVILAVEVLPGSGRVDVAVAYPDPGRFEIRAGKEGFVLAEDFLSVLNGRTAVEDLTPRTVQAYLTRSLAGAFGSGLVVEAADGSVTFRADCRA
jgi:histidine phosphotransferase ChpT